MGKYIHLYDTQQEMNTARADWGGAYTEPWVAASKDSSVVTYNDPEYVEIPEGYTIVKYSSNSSVYDNITIANSAGKITDSLFYTGAYTNVDESNRYFMYNGTVYHATPVYDTTYHELDYYKITGFAVGTYRVIYLRR